MTQTLAAIFDMDGVICHTNPAHSEAFRIFFGRRGFSPSDEEFARHMFGKSNSYILSHFLKREIKGEELQKLENEKEGLFRDIYSDRVEPIAGLPKLLTALKAAGFKLGVATSAPYANLEMILRVLGIGPLFESMMASENVTRHKPDPEVYLKSAHRLGVDPASCIVFEDSFSGITAGQRAGMQVIGVLSSHQPSELPACPLYVNDYIGLTPQKIAALL